MKERLDAKTFKRELARALHEHDFSGLHRDVTIARISVRVNANATPEAVSREIKQQILKHVNGGKNA